MTEQEADAFASVVTAGVIAALDARQRDPVHAEHHEWVKAQIARQKARTEFWQALAAKSLPAIAWSLIATALGWLGRLVVSHITWR